MQKSSSGSCWTDLGVICRILKEKFYFSDYWKETFHLGLQISYASYWKLANKCKHQFCTKSRYHNSMNSYKLLRQANVMHYFTHVKSSLCLCKFMESSPVHKLHRYSRATYNICIFVRFRCPVELGLCECNTSFYYAVTQLIKRCLNLKQKSFDFSNFLKKNVCLNKKSAPKNLLHFLIFRCNSIHTK